MEIKYSKQAFQDFEKLKQYPALVKKVQSLISLLSENPYQTPPTYEKLIGFDSVYSRRINVQHRLVYEVRKDKQEVVIIRMWTHYK